MAIIIRIRYKISILLFILLLTTTCQNTTNPLDPQTAQQTVATAWQQEAHILWEIEWAAIPSGGPLTVESWYAGDHYRYEILEAATPALVGEILIYDGQRAWQYNHLSNESPTLVTTPWLSPISDAFLLIDQRLATPPVRAEQRTVELATGPAQQITLTFVDDETFTLWRDEQTGLPARIHFTINGEVVQLTARELESLPNPPAGLFQPVR